MARHLARAVPVVVISLGLSACAPRLTADEAQADLALQLQLDGSRLTVRSVGDGPQPVVTIAYKDVPAAIRFHRESGLWAVDAFQEGTQWVPVRGRVAEFKRQLEARAQAKWTEQVMPRYAATLHLLVGWTQLLVQQCGEGYPASPRELLAVHSAWHRALFANRGGEFHNPDLFQRDAWWKMFRVSLKRDRVTVQSGGADGRLDTADDMELVAERGRLAGTASACWTHYRLPAFVIEALSTADAPAAWNQSKLIASLKAGEQLGVWGERGR